MDKKVRPDSHLRAEKATTWVDCQDVNEEHAISRHDLDQSTGPHVLDEYEAQFSDDAGTCEGGGTGGVEVAGSHHPAHPHRFQPTKFSFDWFEPLLCHCALKLEMVATGVVLDDLDNQRIYLRHEQYGVESEVGCDALGDTQDCHAISTQSADE
ncbi:MAG: hypothetical protein EOO38_03955 [Cytophagaceae bacterium]|nr:MAG: hypothetical protein EOO38_03955 [Cytophagaceae bacterium]